MHAGVHAAAALAQLAPMLSSAAATALLSRRHRFPSGPPPLPCCLSSCFPPLSSPFPCIAASALHAAPPPQRQEESAEARAVATAGSITLLMLCQAEQESKQERVGEDCGQVGCASRQHELTRKRESSRHAGHTCIAASALPLAACTLAAAEAAAEANFSCTACELAWAWPLQPAKRRG